MRALRIQAFRAVTAAMGLVALVIPLAAHADAPDPCLNHADGALCDDGNPCTTDDVCAAGWCRGNVAPNGTDCTDGNLCTKMDRCVLGLCVGQIVPEGSMCDDGNKCTTDERCTQGLCVPAGNLECNDNNLCTRDLCLPSQGCVFSVVPMCMVPDAGMGGSGGGGGSGMGGSGMGGSGGGGGSGDAGLDATADGPPPDGPEAADAGVDAGSIQDAAAADAAPDVPAQVIEYEVEGGALFCSLTRHPTDGPSGACWLGFLSLLGVGLWRQRSRR